MSRKKQLQEGGSSGLILTPYLNYLRNAGLLFKEDEEADKGTPPAAAEDNKNLSAQTCAGVAGARKCLAEDVGSLFLLFHSSSSTGEGGGSGDADFAPPQWLSPIESSIFSGQAVTLDPSDASSIVAALCSTLPLSFTVGNSAFWEQVCCLLDPCELASLVSFVSSGDIAICGFRNNSASLPLELQGGRNEKQQQQQQ